MHSQGMDKQENQHHPIAGAKQTHDNQTGQQQQLRHYRHPQAAQRSQRRHQCHAQYPGALPGDLNESALDRIDMIDLIKIIGKNTASQAIGQSGKGDHQGKQPDRPLFRWFHLSHSLYSVHRLSSGLLSVSWVIGYPLPLGPETPPRQRADRPGCCLNRFDLVFPLLSEEEAPRPPADTSAPATAP